MNLKIFNPKDFPAYLPKLNSLYDDLFSGGKGFRSKLVQLVSDPLGLPESTQHLLCQTIEFIHNASLLHDDLIDESPLRRGKPAAWKKYSPDYAVLAGDYLLARVMVNLSHFGDIKLVQFTSETISDLLEGEWLQDSVVGDFFVTSDQLDQIHNLKTASLFKWCLRAPFLAAKIEDREIHFLLAELGTHLGQLFQRSDDLLDYNIRNDEGKTILGDLKSGYLNSFGAFVAKDLSQDQVKTMVTSQNLEEFYLSLLVNKDLKNSQEALKNFELKVREFDHQNEAVIKIYEHHLTMLKTKLPSSVQSEQLIKSLKPLTEILYWRRKPSS